MTSGARRAEEPQDRPVRREVLASDVLHRGMVWDVVGETVDLGAAGAVRREMLRHPGAVAVIALDEQDRVLLLRQYRHPVRQELWEPPAGLLDVDGEALQAAAARELAEEADLVAGSWWTLVDYFTSPGGSDEAIRVFLARDLTAVPEDRRHQRVDEEADMEARWFPLDEVVTAALDGRVHNPSTVVAVLAAAASSARGWRDLRPADAPFVPRSGTTGA